jgi:NADPH:quinone reductase-like Zn-dependent oxidoreductase
VGSIAIQLAKHLGATVATTASAANAAYVAELGADVVIDYKSQDFTQVISGYDLVLDTQGGETLMKSLQVLRPGGKVIGITGPPDEGFARASHLSPVLRMVIKMLSAKVNKKARARGVIYEFLFVEASGEQLAELATLIDAKKIQHVVSREFSFADTPEALTAVAHSQISRGKAVVLMNDKA